MGRGGARESGRVELERRDEIERERKIEEELVKERGRKSGGVLAKSDRGKEREKDKMRNI